MFSYTYKNQIGEYTDNITIEEKKDNEQIIKKRYFYVYTTYKENKDDHDIFTHFNNGKKLNNLIDEIIEEQNKKIKNPNFESENSDDLYSYTIITRLRREDINQIKELKRVENIEVWGMNEIEEIVVKNRMFVISFLSNKYPIEELHKGIISVTSKDLNYYNKRQEKILINVFNRNNNMALVLGAGVSVDCGAESWEDLMDLYSDELCRKSSLIDDVEAVYLKVGETDLIKAQLAKDVLDFNGKPHNYYRILHDGLYAKCEFPIHSKKEFEQNITYDSQKDKKYPEGYILYHVAKIIEKNKNKRAFRVMTYNYDNYLEHFVKNSTDLNIEYKSLYSGDNVLDKSIPFYHVHGYLPYTRYKTHIQKTHRESIILTEQDYNNLYNNSYRWEITTQLSLYRENICLFVGSSLRDPNIRRLINMARSDYREHFAIIKKPDNMSLVDYLTVGKHFRKIGVKIIWTNDYGVDLLRKIHEAS